MRNILSIVFVTATLLAFGQKQNDLLAMNTFKKISYKSESSVVKIDLRLTPKYKNSNGDNKDKYIALFVAGLVFTTASILEGNGNYGTWTSTPNSTSQYNQTYTTKPFIQQTPRQIMLFVGIGFTLTGGILSLKK